MIRAFLFCVLLISSAISIAQDRVSVIDLQSAFLATNFSKQELQNLQANESYQQLSNDIVDAKKELQALQKKGQTNGLTWSDSQKKKHVKKMQAKVGSLNQLVNQRSAMEKAVQDKVSQTLGPKIEKIVSEIIKEQGIGLLVNSQAVYFRTAAFDITGEVIKRLNKEN